MLSEGSNYQQRQTDRFPRVSGPRAGGVCANCVAPGPPGLSSAAAWGQLPTSSPCGFLVLCLGFLQLAQPRRAEKFRFAGAALSSRGREVVDKHWKILRPGLAASRGPCVGAPLPTALTHQSHRSSGCSRFSVSLSPTPSLELSRNTYTNDLQPRPCLRLSFWGIQTNQKSPSYDHPQTQPVFALLRAGLPESKNSVPA